MQGDVAWVAEVKSITSDNETRQIRYAIGQVLQYRYSLEWGTSAVDAVIALERPPEDGVWIALCSALGIRLVWPATFESLF